MAGPDQAVLRRFRAVAEGRTINGTYRQFPEQALESFRADLLALVDHVQTKRTA